MLTKVYIGLALALVSFLLLAGGYFYAKHEGAQACVQGDKAVVATAEVKNAGVQAAGTVAGAAEDQARANALQAPVAPTPTVPVGVQPPTVPRCTGTVPAARPAPRAGESAVDLRAEEPAGVVSAAWDSFIAADVQRARDADIEIADRDRLLEERDAVCRGLKPASPGPLP